LDSLTTVFASFEALLPQNPLPSFSSTYPVHTRGLMSTINQLWKSEDPQIQTTRESAREWGGVTEAT
jgi:hypothetical protein